MRSKVFCWRFWRLSRSPSLRRLRRACRASSSSCLPSSRNKSADVGIAALDLKSGESISIRGDVPFPMASTVKVGVAALYLAQVDHGRRSLDDTIGGVPVRSLMARMIIHSDNRATDILFKDLGGPARFTTGSGTMASAASGSTAPSPSCSATGATCGTGAIPALRTRWSICSAGSTAPS